MDTTTCFALISWFVEKPVDIFAKVLKKLIDHFIGPGQIKLLCPITKMVSLICSRGQKNGPIKIIV